MSRKTERLAAHLDTYAALGIDLEPFGANTFRVNALPEIAHMLANELLAALPQEHDKYRALTGDALRDKLASKCACLCAIKAGDALSLAQRSTSYSKFIHPQPARMVGRPAFVAITLEELERRFLRRQVLRFSN